ncbi:hypothetical protein SAY87_008824 [Trapa incisa]|uniref:Calponin-homology (CH) domain-containing protein n=1 Tax=Trapa incisa TaxID=236973 RepID=A0AAN7JXR8_9MYRT|nr:hypothetical protein SAY87_008824 [Trapa incisa]
MDPFQPSSSSSSSMLLKDISNFKTPRRPSSHFKNEASRFNFDSPDPRFFTASKQTPCTAYSSRRTPARSTAAARRLKAFEIEQSRSSRKVQLQKQRSLKILSKSLAAWLNFLFENPRSCGFPGQDDNMSPSGNGKRDAGPRQGVGPENTWRSPKRQRDMVWKVPEEIKNGGGGRHAGFLSSEFVKLRESLKDVCNFDDLAERMSVYLSLSCCRDIFNVMTQVVKNIDDGRLKMKAHCPIVTDFGMKEKAMKILFSYNPVWLRIGLYILLGGDSLLTNEDVDSDKDIAFLKLVTEKQLFSHVELAKTYSYNKKVEGLYRPGYYECLGNIILKRFLLLVLILDRAKSRSSLPLKYGIDGVDGGSPLLFVVGSRIKSSSEMIKDFLSTDVMHGEGNFIAHLVTIGFKVSHHQCPTVEYEFKLVDILEDLQDGVRLCRAIQLLKQDPSILMKLMVPSDTNKKNLANCSIALQYLKKFGVPLYDDDEMEIVADDIANGDKELTLSLVWNMFVHLQIPLLLDAKVLAAEVDRISGVTVDISLVTSFTSVDLLLHWIQAICNNYDLKIENTNSLTDGKAIWCLLDHYFRKELSCSCAPKGSKGEESIMSASDYPDAVHNFVLSQRLTALLGDFPEVLETGDIIEQHGVCNGRSVLLLLAFLASHLVMKNYTDRLNFHKILGCTCQTTGRRLSNLEESSSSSKEKLSLGDSARRSNEEAAKKFKEIQAWWQEMADRSFKSISKTNGCISSDLSSSDGSKNIQKEFAAQVIQSHYRGYRDRHKFMKMRTAVSVLQNAIQVWLLVRKKTLERSSLQNNAALRIQLAWKNFVLKKSLMVQHFAATSIQRHVRGWLTRRTSLVQMKAAIKIQTNFRGWLMRRTYLVQKKAAIKIQTSFCGWLIRRTYLVHVKAALKIQTNFRRHKSQQLFQARVAAERSAILLQSHTRRWMVQRNFLLIRHHVVRIQSHFRGWLRRRDFLLQREAAITIQSSIRQTMFSILFQNQRKTAIKIQHYSLQNGAALRIQHAWKNFIIKRPLMVQHFAATSIQRHVRGWLMRRTSLVQTKAAIKIQANFRGWLMSRTYLIQKKAVIKIQTNFRRLKSGRLFQARVAAARSAILLQSHTRRWMAQRNFLAIRYHVVRIQSYVRGWLRRREFLLQREAAITLQSSIRQTMLSILSQNQTKTAIMIKHLANGQTSDNSLLGPSATLTSSNSCPSSEEMQLILPYILKLQRWWRNNLLLRQQTKSAVTVQAYARRWLARRKASREWQRVVLIQSCWKGYLARKEARGQIVDLRQRMKRTAANIDDSMRLINRLALALSELLNLRSVSSILHTCATLENATRHSQKCCEKIVEAGAIDKLLKLICSMTRSIPDQEVLKHTVSTLRNLARYPHLLEVLIDSHRSMETIFREMLRNKEEGYFIASELLRKVCSHPRGAEIVRRCPALVKRLHSLVEELTRKSDMEKRNPRSLATRENTERRLKEATRLLKLMYNS